MRFFVWVFVGFFSAEDFMCDDICLDFLGRSFFPRYCQTQTFAAIDWDESLRRSSQLFSPTKDGLLEPKFL